MKLLIMPFPPAFGQLFSLVPNIVPYTLILCSSLRVKNPYQTLMIYYSDYIHEHI